MDTTLMSALRLFEKNAPMTRTTRTPEQIARERLANESSMYDASRKTPGRCPRRETHDALASAAPSARDSSVFATKLVDDEQEAVAVVTKRRRSGAGGRTYLGISPATRLARHHSARANATLACLRVVIACRDRRER